MAKDKETSKPSNKAAALRDKDTPGPDEAPVQVRPAGAHSTRDDKAESWDAIDEASDESFPASDPGAKY